MSKPSKPETLAFLRYIRRLFRVWIEKADKDALRLLNGEIGRMRKAVEGRLKE